MAFLSQQKAARLNKVGEDMLKTKTRHKEKVVCDMLREGEGEREGGREGERGRERERGLQLWEVVIDVMCAVRGREYKAPRQFFMELTLGGALPYCLFKASKVFSGFN